MVSAIHPATMYHLRGLLWGDIPGDRQKLLQFLKKATVMSLTGWSAPIIHLFTHIYFFYQLGDGNAVSLQYYLGVGTRHCRVRPIISKSATGIDIMNICATCQLF
jgi:hypothetical protein